MVNIDVDKSQETNLRKYLPAAANSNSTATISLSIAIFIRFDVMSLPLNLSYRVGGVIAVINATTFHSIWLRVLLFS